MNGPQTKTIDGMSVTCVPLDGWDGYALLPDLASVIAPLLSMVKDSFKGGSSPSLEDMDLDLEKIFEHAGKSLSGDKLPELMVRLLRGTVIVTSGPEGTVKHEVRDRASFGLAFSGPRFWSAFKVAAFAARVTYGDFSSALGQLVDLLPAP
jgi:hypothetical protein